MSPRVGRDADDNAIEEVVVAQEQERLQQRLTWLDEEIDRCVEAYEERKSELDAELRRCDRKLDRFHVHGDEWKQWRQRRENVKRELDDRRRQFRMERRELEEQRREVMEDLEVLDAFADMADDIV